MSIGSRYSLTRRLGRYGRPTVLALKDCNFFDSRMRVALTWPFHSGGAGASANGRIKLVRACTAGLRVYTSGSISTLLKKSFRGRRTAHIRPRGETRRMVSPVYELHVASGRGARDAFEPPRVFLMHSRDMPTSFPPRLDSSHAPLPRAWNCLRRLEESLCKLSASTAPPTLEGAGTHPWSKPSPLPSRTELSAGRQALAHPHPHAAGHGLDVPIGRPGGARACSRGS